MFTPKETQQLEQLLVQHAVANEDNPLSPALNDIEQEVLAVFRTASARIEEHS